MKGLLRVKVEGNVAIADVLANTLTEEVNIEEFGHELNSLIVEKNHRNVVLDMSRVAYLSSVALGKLIAFDRRMKRSGGRWSLCGITSTVSDIFDSSKLSAYFQIIPDRVSAIGWLNGIEYGTILTISTACPLSDCGQSATSGHHENFRHPASIDSWSIVCPRCSAKYDFQGQWPQTNEPTNMLIQSVELKTYNDEYVSIVPSVKVYDSGSHKQLSLIRVVGRLDLYAAEAVERLWRSLPDPRWIIIDFSLATEVSEKGFRSLHKFHNGKSNLHRAAALLPTTRTDLISTHFAHGADRVSAARALGTMAAGTGCPVSVCVRKISINERPVTESKADA